MYFSYIRHKPLSRFLNQTGFFNLTATFRSDSDFPIPYWRTEPRNKPCMSCLPNSTILKQKNKFLTWFVSNCNTNSQREKYFEKLSNYIPTEKMGKCRTKTSCDRDKRKTNCTLEVVQKSKFYFSAENAICKDYITGKTICLTGGMVLPVAQV